MRNDAAKHEEELHATLSFLRHMGWKVLSVEEKREKPDIRVNARIGGSERRLGIEATQYDAAKDEAEEKPGTEAAQDSDHNRLRRDTVVYWRSLQEGIEKRAMCYPQLANVCGQILFYGNSAPTPKQKDAFVDECMALALEVVTGSAWTSASSQILATFPQNYLLLQRYVKRLQLQPGPAAQHRWQVGTRGWSSGGRPTWNWVRRTITCKGEALRQYDTCGLDEVWLLMYCLPPEGAGRHGATTLMSPRPEFLGELPAEVVTAAKESGFQHVFLYNHMCGWDVELSA